MHWCNLNYDSNRNLSTVSELLSLQDSKAFIILQIITIFSVVHKSKILRILHMSVFWVVKTCGLVAGYHCSGGTYCRHPQGWEKTNIGIFTAVKTSNPTKRASYFCEMAPWICKLYCQCFRDNFCLTLKAKRRKYSLHLYHTIAQKENTHQLYTIHETRVYVNAHRNELSGGVFS